MSAERLLTALDERRLDPVLTALYGGAPDALATQRARYKTLIEQHRALFPKAGELDIFSSPGRTEVGGNHTDHNAGRVLAAAVNLDVVAVAAKSDDDWIVVESEGYPTVKVHLDQLAVVEAEQFTPAALTRGVAARLKQLGRAIGGFRACAASTVPKASGLSSSAAFEVLIATILNEYYNGGAIDPVTIAQIAQFSENEYFGKPCGLMDQTTCSVGGLVTIDFKDFAHPIVRKVDCEFGAAGYAMIIIDTGGNHADLNEDYIALEHEMKSVARALGAPVLREVPKEKILANIKLLRGQVNDRAILRALHFHDDDQRVVDQVRALENADFPEFLRLIIESGYSSWMWCQNCYSHQCIEEQGVSIALAVSENLLKGHGAWRVHGGGFAGTIQAFVPHAMLEGYLGVMRGIFGEEACHALMIRSAGSIKLNCAG